MGLLQIGGKATKRCAGRVVGIDLGTTNSLATAVIDGKPTVLFGDGELPAVPSVVWFGEDGAIEVGRTAKEKAGVRADRTLASVKRFMGRGQSDVKTIDRLSPYRFHAEQDGPVVYFELGPHRRITPIEVSAEILKTLRARAETALDGEVEGAVITVPAYFDDAQRQATKDAARLAGLPVLRLLNEPTAAALAYGLDKKKEGLFAVFDLGGGTFDISILKLEVGVFQVLATGGDSQLGGDDFDLAVAEHFLQAAGQAPKTAPPDVAARALAAARDAKERLTTATEAELTIEGQSFSLTRVHFESLIEPVMRRLQAPIRRVLKDIDLEGEGLDGVVMVGGSTRVPAVIRMAAKFFAQTPLSDLDPDQVVALGASIQADLLGGTGQSEDVVLLDVLPLSLGVETMGGVVEKLLFRNQPIPAQAEQEFTTYADHQTAMDVHVLQGERELVEDCRSLAQFRLRGIPPLAAGIARIGIRYEVDADGILHVSAQEKSTGVHASIEVKPSYGLKEEDIEEMLLASLEHAGTDLERRLLAEARVEARRVLNALQAALTVDGHLLGANERAEIEASAKLLETAVEQADHQMIQRIVEELEKKTLGFAERRMNQSVKQALEGQQI